MMQRGSDELLSQAAVMAPASDNNNQDLATKKAKLDSSTVLAGGIGKSSFSFYNIFTSHLSFPPTLSPSLTLSVFGFYTIFAFIFAFFLACMSGCCIVGI